MENLITLSMVLEFSIGLIFLTMGFSFLWIWRKIAKKEYLKATTKTKDYLYAGLICFGASIYALAASPLFGDIFGSQTNPHPFQQIASFGVLSMIAFMTHFLSSYNPQKSYFAPVIDAICIILLLMCVFDFRFYRDDSVLYCFIFRNLEITLRAPDIGYKVLSILVLFIIIYSTYVFAIAYFKKRHRYVVFLFAGTFLMAILGLHDLLWGVGIIKKPFYPLFEGGVGAFIFGMRIKLGKDFFDAFSKYESHIKDLQNELKGFFGVEEETQDPFMLTLYRELKEEIGNPKLTVEKLAGRMNMSLRTFERQLKKVTGGDPTTFIRNRRLERGASLLKNTSKDVAQIAYKVGFNSPAYFTKCFRERYGMTPSQYHKEHFQPQ